MYAHIFIASNMKTIKKSSIITAFGFGALLMSFGPIQKLEKLTIKPESSKIEWFAEKITGQHNGLINLKRGSITVEDGQLKGGSFIVDMTTIKVTDLQGEYAQKLEWHLNSADFFNTAEYKTAEFTITGVKPQTGEEYNSVINGNLTIKGITHPTSFPAKIETTEGKFAAYGEMVIDRSKYDVRYGSNSFFDNLGDKAIYDEFTMKVSLGAKL